MDQLSDGTIIQGGLRHRTPGNPDYMPFPVLGIVVNVYHLDDKDNIQGDAVLCDIHIPEFGFDLFRVPHTYGKSSHDNFIDYRPRPTTKKVTPKGEEPDPLDDVRLDPTKVDGDMVLVAFINGVVHQPIIIASLGSVHSGQNGLCPYPRKGKEAGDHARVRMNGLDCEIDKDGNLTIKSTKTLEKINPNKKVLIQLAVEQDDPDVPESQKQSIEIEIDNSEGSPKVRATVVENTGDQKKQEILLDAAAQTTTITAEHSDGVNELILSPAGMNMNIKGSVVMAIDGDASVSVTGKATIQADGDVDIESGGTATVKAATKAVVDCADIELGKGATEAVIKGDAFKQFFDQHLHISPVGNTSPPIQPMDVPPNTHLSNVSKTK